MTDSLEWALEERLLARSQVSPRDVDALRVFARTLPARRPFWRGPTVQWTLSAAAIVLAAVVVLPMLFRVPGFGGDPTPPPTPSPTAPAPTQPAETPAPTVSAPAPTPDIALGPIRLAVASGSVVNVTIDDPERLLTGAAANQASPGMSFAWFNSDVTRLENGAYRVTWVGYPRDEEVRLEVSRGESGKLLLHFIQAAPLPNTDGEGEDRVMVIELAEPIDATDIEVTFDTP